MAASKSIKLSLHQQAIQIVQKREKQESRKEIAREYRRLLYQSQMRKTDEKTIIRIKKVGTRLPPMCSMGGNIINNHVSNTLKDYVQKRKYHPRTLKEIEEYTKTGKWPASMMGEDPDA